MSPIIRIAAASELVLTVGQAAFPASQTVLPLGGSQSAQIAILLGAAYATSEILVSLGKILSRGRRRRRLAMLCHCFTSLSKNKMGVMKNSAGQAVEG
jgi:hypothetical protein